jgi:multiple antibiotic resistance protein
MTELINIFFLVVAALFPIVNPLGNVPIFLRLTQHSSAEIRNALARRIALGGFLLLLGSVLLGSHILVFFGITLPVVRVAGGLVVTVMAWRLLNQGDNPIEDQPTGTVQDQALLDQSFYPMTMPLTVGPGSIAASIALGSQRPLILADFSHFVLEAAAAIAGLITIAASIYLSYRFAERIEKILGRTGTNVMMRLSAFILLCIGMQIVWNGLSNLLNLQQG